MELPAGDIRLRDEYNFEIFTFRDHVNKKIEFGIFFKIEKLLKKMKEFVENSLEITWGVAMKVKQ